MIPMENDQLLEYVFGQGNLFSPALSRWIGSSERFKSFVEEYKEKVRKKVTKAQKGKGDREEALKDVLYELHAAHLMLRCDQFTILPKPTYMVRIGSASGEADVLGSKDRDPIEHIVRAMNKAIIERG
jgi:hypothetical protein